MAIQFLFCLNKQGILRISKVYNHKVFQTIENSTEKNDSVFVNEVFKLISTRDHKKQSNFVPLNDKTKLIYKRYAGLYFILGVDLADEDELLYLTNIHFLVEVLDQFFGNVCELDIVFNFYKVYMCIDEIFQAGEIVETDKDRLQQRLQLLNKLD
ncbi:probable AP-2 complex subunit sigma [Saccharomycodes ludwigii]|uniref:AP complex subunit sigma n=1 Tax=Saccharomycodes ludwigii TaxID=36035 RepID=A0A376B214_9ASCO|nr:hypothetical protein SCDLUD_000430 [Saccharomycodes ludwigii]KAH3902838.1 hypothetical protein SCDLUD_000430 [Saccharomycodes ludwigii]SSD58726.1 probable AP-2 complex subunit sigma [Saccharomycodes ludwigii]